MWGAMVQMQAVKTFPEPDTARHCICSVSLNSPVPLYRPDLYDVHFRAEQTAPGK